VAAAQSSIRSVINRVSKELLGSHLDELRAHLVGGDGLQLGQLLLVAHGAHQGEAVSVGEQVFDGLPDLQATLQSASPHGV